MTPLRLGPLLLLGACVINGDAYPRPRDLPPQWQVDKLRILAIQADPPEIAPGGTATLSALLVDPDATTGLTVWAWCDASTATDFGCPLDPTRIDPGGDREELFAQGIAGIEPILAPELTADPEWLEGLDAQQRLEGVNMTVNALALPQDGGDTGSFDFNLVESAFKRVVVSEAVTPNENPTIARFTVDGVVLGPDQRAVLDPGRPYELGLELSEDAIETYLYRTSEGIDEERVEEPYAEWYATAGTVDEFFTLHPYLQSTWISPAAGTEGTWWAVLKDRRGGVTWVSRDFQVVE